MYADRAVLLREYVCLVRTRPALAHFLIVLGVRWSLTKRSGLQSKLRLRLTPAMRSESGSGMRPASPPGPLLYVLYRQEDELRVTAEQLTLVRRARLSELYTAEREE